MKCTAIDKLQDWSARVWHPATPCLFEVGRQGDIYGGISGMLLLKYCCMVPTHWPKPPRETKQG